MFFYFLQFLCDTQLELLLAIRHGTQVLKMSHQRQHLHHRSGTLSMSLDGVDSTRQDLLDLAEHLRQEKLYVQHEKNEVS